MNENSIGNIKIIFYIVEILSFGGVQAQKLKNLLWEAIAGELYKYSISFI